MSELAYVAGKYDAAVGALAGGDGRIQERIYDAAVASYGFPNPMGLPDAIRERIQELHKYLTKYPEQDGEGKYRASLAHPKEHRSEDRGSDSRDCSGAPLCRGVRAPRRVRGCRSPDA